MASLATNDVVATETVATVVASMSSSRSNTIVEHALPLLSRAGERRIVHFAKLYARAPDSDAVDSLADLADELAAAARQQRQHRLVEADALGGVSAGVTRVIFAPDQLQLLLTTRENPVGASASDHLSHAPVRHSDAKGKPMVRFLATAASPFTYAVNTAHMDRAVRACATEERDELFTRVQQLQWEENILWGTDFSAVDQRTRASSDQVVETEDGGGVAASSSQQASTGVNRSTVVASQSQSTRVSAYQRVQQHSRAEPVSTFNSAADEAFDMTKPRHYRWEIAEESTTSSRVSRATASTVAAVVGSAPLATTRMRADLPCPLNAELQNDSWVHAIGWRATQDMPESRLVLDANDASLVFSVPGEMEDSRPTLRIPERKLGAAEQRLEQLDKQRREKKQRIDEVMGRLEFGEETAEGRLGTEGGGKKQKDTRVVKNIGLVHHSLPAIKLSLTKPELPKTKLRDFHRPRGKFKINERLALTPPPPVPLASKDESAMLITQIKKSSDLTPTAGGKLILIEYTEQHPPMLSNPGMAARILHYWRPPESDDDFLTLGRKKGKKAKPKPPDMKMGQVITLGDHDESPFVGDIPAGRVVTSLNSKLYKVPIFPHEPLAPFAATPASREKRDHELFLLCRAVSSKSKKGSGGAGGLGGLTKTTVHVLELPDVFLAGQVEPQSEVPAPNSRSANDFIRPYMSFHILRLFKKASDGERLKIEDIARAFPNQSGTAIRKRMKEVATFERGGNDSGWWKKKPAAQLTSEEEIRASIPPESVCLYESMMAGHRRLLDIGLTKLFTPSGVHGAITHLLKRLELRKQSLSAKLVEPRNLERRAKERADEALWKADAIVRKLETDIQVARYIDEQLQLTPWNLTNNYVECHLQGKGSGMLKLGGIGDPTGRGEGFSFVRVPQSRAKKKDGDGDDATTVAMSGSASGGASAEAAAVQKAVAAVTGTTADLRKLKMKEAGDVLRNLGLAEADIKKLRRWDRIHMVRELSSRATAHGVAGSLSKFARGARKSLSAQQQEYRKKCDVIYERQMDVLSSTKMTFSSDDESEGEDDDLDEWEKDIEAGITGGREMEKLANRGPKNLFTKGGGGLNRSKEVLAEREDAVELRRLMQEMKEDSGTASASASAVHRPDVDASKLRHQLRASGMINEGSVTSFGGNASRSGGLAASHGGSVVSSAIATPTEHLSRPGSPSGGRTAPPSASTVPGRKVLKRTTRMIDEDGSETVKIEFIVDEKVVARFKALQQRKARQLKSDERTLLRKRKRMLALEGGGDASGSAQSLLEKAKKRKQLQEELKQLQITEEQNKGYQALLQTQGEAAVVLLAGTPQKGVIRCTQCGQVGHMRTNRSCPLYMAAAASKKTTTGGAENSDNAGSGRTGAAADGSPLKLKVKAVPLPVPVRDDDEDVVVEKITVNLTELREGARKHHAEKKRKRLQEVREQAELYKRPYLNNVVKPSRSRMPASHLNSNLTRVVRTLLDVPESELFRTPVDASVVTDYYAVIKQPMDLGTVARKADALEYDSMREFIKDLELIVSNSRAYNGDPTKSLITANAAKVLRRAQEELATLHAEGGMAPPPQ